VLDAELRGSTAVAERAGRLGSGLTSGASMTGPPHRPRAIGTVGRISRSYDHNESNPMRSAFTATCGMISGEASLSPPKV
jgi:hypothetical protein